MAREVEIRFTGWERISDDQAVRPGFVGKREAVTLFVNETVKGWAWQVVPTGHIAVNIASSRGKASSIRAAQHAAERAIGLRR